MKCILVMVSNVVVIVSPQCITMILGDRVLLLKGMPLSFQFFLQPCIHFHFLSTCFVNRGECFSQCHIIDTNIPYWNLGFPQRVPNMGENRFDMLTGLDLDSTTFFLYTRRKKADVVCVWIHDCVEISKKTFVLTISPLSKRLLETDAIVRWDSRSASFKEKRNAAG